ncbi:hypothetical protein ACTMU2_36745 [Cupriavidus basilensis]
MNTSIASASRNATPPASCSTQYFVMFNNLMEAWIDELLPEGFQA